VSLPSVSGLVRAEQCPGSESLPHVRSVTRDSARGDAIHRFLARIPEIGYGPALAEVPEEYRDAAAAIDVSELPASEPGAYASEVSWAYNVETGKVRELGRGIGRDAAYAALAPMEIPGTGDNAGLLGVDAVIVTDYKAGWAGHVPPAREHFALHVYAFMAARCWGRSRAVVAIIRVLDGEPRIDRAELDALELDAIEERLLGIVRGVLAERAEYRAGNTVKLAEGDWCRWCPAFAACPAKVALAASLGRGEYDDAILTRENAAAVWTKLQGARAVLDRIEGALKTLAQVDPIALPDGRILGPVEKRRESIENVATAAEIIASRFDEATAKAAVETSMTKAGLKRALQIYRERSPGLKVSIAERELMKTFRETGVAKVTVRTSIEAYEPEEEQKALPAPAEATAP
jgi:hypothetical protein